MSNPLTPRQLEVAQLIGFPDKEIAKRLGISEETVAFHIQSIKKRLGLGSRVQIALWLERAAA